MGPTDAIRWLSAKGLRQTKSKGGGNKKKAKPALYVPLRTVEQLATKRHIKTQLKALLALLAELPLTTEDGKKMNIVVEGTEPKMGRKADKAA